MQTTMLETKSRKLSLTRYTFSLAHSPPEGGTSSQFKRSQDQSYSEEVFRCRNSWTRCRTKSSQEPNLIFRLRPSFQDPLTQTVSFSSTNSGKDQLEPSDCIRTLFQTDVQVSNLVLLIDTLSIICTFYKGVFELRNWCFLQAVDLLNITFYHNFMLYLFSLYCLSFKTFSYANCMCVCVYLYKCLHS